MKIFNKAVWIVIITIILCWMLLLNSCSDVKYYPKTDKLIITSITKNNKLCNYLIDVPYGDAMWVTDSCNRYRVGDTLNKLDLGKTYKDGYKGGANKMKPFVADKDLGRDKIVPDYYDLVQSPSKQQKLIAKNANRSRKKAARQELNKWREEDDDYIDSDSDDSMLHDNTP